MNETLERLIEKVKQEKSKKYFPVEKKVKKEETPIDNNLKKIEKEESPIKNSFIEEIKNKKKIDLFYKKINSLKKNTKTISYTILAEDKKETEINAPFNKEIKERENISNNFSSSDKERESISNNISSSDKEGESISNRIISYEKNGEIISNSISSSDKEGESISNNISSSDKEGESISNRIVSYEKNGEIISNNISSSDKEKESISNNISSSDKEKEIISNSISSSDKEKEIISNSISSSDKEKNNIYNSIHSYDKEKEIISNSISSSDKEGENISNNISSSDKDGENISNNISSSDKEKEIISNSISSSDKNENPIQDNNISISNKSENPIQDSNIFTSDKSENPIQNNNISTSIKSDDNSNSNVSYEKYSGDINGEDKNSFDIVEKAKRNQDLPAYTFFDSGSNLDPTLNYLGLNNYANYSNPKAADNSANTQMDALLSFNSGKGYIPSVTSSISSDFSWSELTNKDNWGNFDLDVYNDGNNSGSSYSFYSKILSGVVKSDSYFKSLFSGETMINKGRYDLSLTNDFKSKLRTSNERNGKEFKSSESKSTNIADDIYSKSKKQQEFYEDSVAKSGQYTPEALILKKEIDKNNIDKDSKSDIEKKSEEKINRKNVSLLTKKTTAAAIEKEKADKVKEYFSNLSNNLIEGKETKLNTEDSIFKLLNKNNIQTEKPLNETISSVGYLRVTDSISKYYDIPLQNNLEFNEFSRKAEYNSLEFLGRYGSIKQYAKTDGMSLSVSTNYFRKDNKTGNYTLEELQKIQNKYKNLVNPITQKDINDFETRETHMPPIVNIILQAQNSDVSENIDIKTNLFTDYDSKGEKYFKNYVVSDVTISKDTDKYNYILGNDDNNKKFINDLDAFSVSLSLTEIDGNYLNRLPAEYKIEKE